MEEDDPQITTTIHLRLDPSTSVWLQLPSLEVGVDFGAIGDALGLQPSTVRLNGHFLSRDERGISTVTWRYLLSFFSSRGFPTGIGGGGDSLLVQGTPVVEDFLCCYKSASAAYGVLDLGGSRCNISDASDEKVLKVPAKRKLTVDDEKTSKKKKSARCDVSASNEARDFNFHLKRKCCTDNENFFNREKSAHPDPNLQEGTHDFTTDDSTILSLKRISLVDDNIELKKRKTMGVVDDNIELKKRKTMGDAPRSAIHSADRISLVPCTSSSTFATSCNSVH